MRQFLWFVGVAAQCFKALTKSVFHVAVLRLKIGNLEFQYYTGESTNSADFTAEIVNRETTALNSAGRRVEKCVSGISLKYL